ncbi:MAG: PepSY domain-containing protein [Tepidisphaeraceae bacterium]
MRKYHRWLSVLFGIFLLWIGATGLLSQIGGLVNNGGFEEERGPAAAAAPVGFTCPETMTCRPKRLPKPGEWDVGFLHHIHSGEQFGPAGVIVSMLSGAALLFFAFSGLWMYIQMFRRRAHRASHPKRIFW